MVQKQKLYVYRLRHQKQSATWSHRGAGYIWVQCGGPLVPSRECQRHESRGAEGAEWLGV